MHPLTLSLIIFLSVFCCFLLLAVYLLRKDNQLLAADLRDVNARNRHLEHRDQALNGLIDDGFKPRDLH